MTVQRARPVVLTALAAILAFVPLTHSVFWGTLAYTLIGGTFAGTLKNLGTFNYTNGTFVGRLVNQGVVSLGSSFTASCFTPVTDEM